MTGLRIIAGIRGDLYGYDVHAKDAAAAALGEGTGTATLASPKIAVAYKATNWLEFYANWGRGFHSNDVRGAVTATPVPVLVKGTGKELGARAQLGNLSLTATYWWLDLGSELKFVGDSNAVEPTGASTRHGYELVAFWRPAKWLAIDGNFTASHARYVNGDYIPNAFENAGQIGASLILDKWKGSVHFRHLGPYPLIEDNSERDSGSNVLSVRGAYHPGHVEIYAEVVNLLNSRDKDVAYSYESYIPAFDSAPTDGPIARVLEPRTVRVGMTYKF